MPHSVHARNIGFGGMGHTEEAAGLLSTGLLLAGTGTFDINPYAIQGATKWLEIDIASGTATLPDNFYGESFAAIEFYCTCSVLTAAGNNREGRLRLMVNGAPVPNYAEVDCHTTQRRGATVGGLIQASPTDRLSLRWENIDVSDTEFLFVMVGMTLDVIDLYSL